VTVHLVLLILLTLTLAATAAKAADHPGDRARAQAIDRALATYRSPLAGQGAAMVAAGRRHHVSAELIAAISGVESTFGRAACGRNAWGLGSCRGFNFTSWPAAIDYVARLLRQRYLDQGLVTLQAIGRVYCPPCGPAWPRQVSWLMRHVFHVTDTPGG
jgi:hypothetical protein